MEVKEAYCSHEISKLLKEKGFDIPTLAFYWSEKSNMYQSRKDKVIIPDNQERNWNEAPDVMYSCPTHQMACAWVRKKGWHISVELSYDDNYNAVYYVTISSTKTFLAEDIGELENKYFSKVEDATDESLKFVLTNLI